MDKQIPSEVRIKASLFTRKDIKKLVKKAFDRFPSFTPVANQPWCKCFVIDDGHKEFFYNDPTGSTRMALL